VKTRRIAYFEFSRGVQNGVFSTVGARVRALQSVYKKADAVIRSQTSYGVRFLKPFRGAFASLPAFRENRDLTT
jgi:hypothetical protein